ncbi:MAG TPA: hypothetical protein VG965_05040 [Patescibacteria group bacterium]|nr:hypothetical protein [Patescibacteria group bacterium]
MPKLKIERDEEVQEGEIVETQWDFKKIAIGLVVLVVIFIGISYFFLPKSGEDTALTATLGASTSSEDLSPTPPLPKKEDVQKVITNVRDTLSKITSDNITSSQAAIQKIITDLQGLQGKNGAAETFCKLVCNNK